MIAQVFADESGEGLETGIFLLAGYTASVETWSKFSEDWQTELNRMGLPPIHMAYFERCSNEFEGLAKRDRDLALDQLVEVIIRHKLVPFEISVDTALYKKIRPGSLSRLQEKWAHPYLIASQFLVGAMFGSILKHPKYTGLEVLFDCHQKFRNIVREHVEKGAFRFVKASFPDDIHRLGQARVVRPGEEQNYLPLQAADLCAWHFHRARTNQDGKHRRAYKRLRLATHAHHIPMTEAMLRKYFDGLATVTRNWE